MTYVTVLLHGKAAVGCVIANAKKHIAKISISTAAILNGFLYDIYNVSFLILQYFWEKINYHFQSSKNLPAFSLNSLPFLTKYSFAADTAIRISPTIRRYTHQSIMVKKSLNV